ncbi:hypothetical protein KC329_g108 [Hortaea werneckii]|nr:hypothetical protein KC329_g108 [Hortaea werneckii]
MSVYYRVYTLLLLLNYSQKAKMTLLFNQTTDSHTCYSRKLVPRIAPTRTTIASPTLDAIETPDNGGHQHHTSSDPRQHQELAALICADPDVVAVLVDNFAGFDCKGGGNSTCDSHHQECKPIHHHIDERPQPSFEEYRNQCCQKRDRDQGDGDAVEYKSRVRCCLERLQPIIDILGPIELIKVDIDSALVQLLLKDFLGVEPSRWGQARERSNLRRSPEEVSVSSISSSIDDVTSSMKELSGLGVELIARSSMNPFFDPAKRHRKDKISAAALSASGKIAKSRIAIMVYVPSKLQRVDGCSQCQHKTEEIP